jgi:hypothetical protein
VTKRPVRMLTIGIARLIAPAMLLAGCSSDGGGDYKQFLTLIRQGFSQSFSSNAITREQAAAIPYASMGYRINGSREALIVLATDTGGDLLWTSNSHIVLVTRDGRLTRSVGLAHDLGGQTAQEPGGIPSPAAAMKRTLRYRRSEDFPDTGLYNVALECSLTTAGPQTINILQHAIATIRIAERCSATTQGWSFTDSFWVDPGSGFVWRSQQHIHPKGDVLETEIFRPPG